MVANFNSNAVREMLRRICTELTLIERHRLLADFIYNLALHNETAEEDTELLWKVYDILTSTDPPAVQPKDTKPKSSCTRLLAFPEPPKIMLEPKLLLFREVARELDFDTGGKGMSAVKILLSLSDEIQPGIFLYKGYIFCNSNKKVFKYNTYWFGREQPEELT